MTDLETQRRQRWLAEMKVTDQMLEEIFDDAPAREHEAQQDKRAMLRDAIALLAVIALLAIILGGA